MLEANSELLVKLLTTIGKLVDTPKAGKFMTTYFSQIRELSREDQVFSSRIRFMFQDLLELRANHWVPRREENVPKTLQEVHNEALIKDYEDEMQIVRPVVPRNTVDIKSKPSSASSSPTPSPSGRAGGFDDWTVAGGAKKKSNGKSKKKKQSDSLTLLPGGFSPNTISPAISPRGPAVEDPEQRVADILEDYISSGDARDTANAVREFKGTFPQLLYKVVEVAIASTIDKKDAERDLVSKLFVSLSQEKVLAEEHFIKGFQAVLENADDLEIDVPLAPKLIGKFVSRAIQDTLLAPTFVDSLPPKVKAAVSGGATN